MATATMAVGRPGAYKELAILAGPTCGGKTRFLQSLTGRRISDILSAPPASYFVESRWTFEPPSADRVILHYALPIAPLMSGEFRSLDDDPRLNLIASAERVIAITLLVRPEIHAHRFQLRTRDSYRVLSKGFRKYLSERRRLKLMCRLCAESETLTGAYEAWFEYIDNRCDEHYIVTANDAYEVMARSHWPRLRQEYWAT